MSTSNRTVDWYNDNADQYAKHVNDPDDSVYHAFYEKPAIRAELPDVSGKNVLSLGCGSGIDTQYLKDKGAKRACGVDISGKLIEIARQNYPDCEFEVMDMEALTHKDTTFDLVYSSLAMHYLQGGPVKVFKEAFRVLKPGGVLLFSDSHPLDSAMEVMKINEQVQDKKIGTIKNKGQDTEEDFGDYLTPRLIPYSGTMAVDIWHQPLGLTVNQIIETGFLLDKIIEFEPTEGMRKVSPRNFKRLKRIPEMIIFKAHKPANS